MYYLRKLSKNTTLNKIKSVANIDDVDADVLKQEFPTTGNALSFWGFDSLDHISDPITAAVLAGTEIKKTKFIITDDSLLEKYGLKTDSSEPGKTGYIGSEDSHVNICNLTYGKIGDVLRMIKEIAEIKDYTCEVERGELKALIIKASEKGKINEKQMNEKLVNDIHKYMLNEPRNI